jgi:hypothetical protein
LTELGELEIASAILGVLIAAKPEMTLDQRSR